MSPAGVPNMGSMDSPQRFANSNWCERTHTHTSESAIHKFHWVSEWVCLLLSFLLPLKILWFYLLTTDQCHPNSYASPLPWKRCNDKTSIITLSVGLQVLPWGSENLQVESLSDHTETPPALSLWNLGP